MSRRLSIFAVLLTAFVFSGASASAAEHGMRTKAPDGAEVYFIEPQDGEVVSKSFSVKFGLRGMGVAPAGVDKHNTGHHHLLVNVETLPDLSGPLPASEEIIHFGGGQTETSLTLPPGKHTLQLLLGNHLHVPHDPPIMSEKITVIVK